MNDAQYQVRPLADTSLNPRLRKREKIGMKGKALSMRSRIGSVPLLLLILLLLLICFSAAIKGEENGVTDQHDEEVLKNEKPTWVRSVSALAETAIPYSAVYMEKTRSVVEKAKGYLFRPRRPDIDFRGCAEEEEGKEATASVGGRAKEAASKSLEGSKSTLEDSAKLAGDTLQQMTATIKSKFTGHPPAPEWNNHCDKDEEIHTKPMI